MEEIVVTVTKTEAEVLFISPVKYPMVDAMPKIPKQNPRRMLGIISTVNGLYFKMFPAYFVRSLIMGGWFSFIERVMINASVVKISERIYIARITAKYEKKLCKATIPTDAIKLITPQNNPE